MVPINGHFYFWLLPVSWCFLTCTFGMNCACNKVDMYGRNEHEADALSTRTSLEGY